MAGPSSSAAIRLRNEELERQLAEMKWKNSGSISAAYRLRNEELELQIAAMKLSEPKSGAMSSGSVAIKLKNEALERQLAEMMGKKSGGGLSSESVAIKLKNEALERQLAEMMGKKSGGELSSESVAIKQKNEALERQVAEMMKKSGVGLSSESVAIKQKNEELEKRLAEIQRHRPGGITSASGHRLEGVDERHPLGLRSDPISRGLGLSLPPGRQRKVNERQVKLMQLMKAAQELDLAFLVDVTGSMQKIIKKVKDKIPSIAASVKKQWPDLKLQVAFAPYRDYEDFDRDNDETCDFTDDFSGSQSVFIKALSQVSAGGGGDIAEDVFSGLQRAARLSWRSKTRVIVHIGDAPCHGSEFHSGGSDIDEYLDGDMKRRRVGTLLKTLRDDCRVLCYLFVHINSSTQKMVAAFRQHAGAANWIHEEKLTSIENLAKIVVTVATSTISQSVRVGDHGEAEVPKHLPLPVHPKLPDWNKVRAVPARQIKYKFPNSLEDLFQILATGGELDAEEMLDSSMQIAPYPFSDTGSIRWPYHAIVHQPPQAPRHMVVKRFKTSPGQDVNKVHAEEAYFEQMEVQTVAAYMAQKFNDELASRSFTGDYKTVEFTMVSTVAVGAKFYNMERHLQGNWIRYTNNLNYVNTEEYAATLHAFSHWTYDRSNGLLMVTDLQGVKRDENEFLLCDPALHCKDSCRYERTRTNFGEPGMKQFLHTHQCNNICRSLLLTPTRNAPTRIGTHLV